MHRKQSDSNERNVRTFCSVVWSDPNSSCARTDAAFMGGASGSRRHVAVRRVVNAWGPQTMQAQAELKTIKVENETSASFDEEERFNVRSNNSSQNAVLERKGLLPSVEERVANIESRLRCSNHGWLMLHFYSFLSRFVLICSLIYELRHIFLAKHINHFFIAFRKSFRANQSN